MEENFEQYFRWISLVHISDVLLLQYPTIMLNAINGLKAKQLNMDLPVLYSAIFILARQAVMPH